jgi:glycosyltransferase involved in cell wall biosynthesis
MPNTALPQFILTLNHRFVPASDEDGYCYGVVGFVLEVARELERRKQLCGILAYNRQRGIKRPFLNASSVLGFQCIEFGFDFAIEPETLRNELARAVQLLSRYSGDSSHGSTIMYHQTNVLLPITSSEIPFLITHHAPFASEVVRLFGHEMASQAFQGGVEKLRHLIDHQRAGVNFLRNHPRGIALEMSPVQMNILRLQGVPEFRVRGIPPPLQVSKQTHDLCAKDTGIASARSGLNSQSQQRSLHLLTATARPDAFKNLHRLTEAYRRIAEAGLDVRLTIFTGEVNDEEARNQLVLTIPPHLRSGVRITARLSHEELVKFFIEQRDRAVFVCTSLYETFGLTPVEAALHGMATLVPDQPSRIGAAAYLPQDHRYRPDIDGLFEKIMGWHQNGSIGRIGKLQQAVIGEHVGVEKCVDSLCHAAREMVGGDEYLVTSGDIASRR